MILIQGLDKQGEDGNVNRIQNKHKSNYIPYVSYREKS